MCDGSGTHLKLSTEVRGGTPQERVGLISVATGSWIHREWFLQLSPRVHQSQFRSRSVTCISTDKIACTAGPPLTLQATLPNMPGAYAVLASAKWFCSH